MSVNPLFSGVGQSTRQFQQSLRPGHPSAAGSGGDSSKVSRHPPPHSNNTMESSLPRKKPRLNSGGNTMTDNGDDDPFGDFEDSWTADDLDAIDLIASQALSQAPPSSASHLQKERSPSASSSQFQPRQFNNSTSSHGFHASSDFPKKMLLPSSSFPSVGSRRPVQANMSVPFHQLGNRGTMLPPSSGGNNFLKKRADVNGRGDGGARNQLTPPKGSTVQDQPALPLGTQDKSTELQRVQQQLERFKAETERLNQQLTNMKYRKDGEIELLRQNLNKAQADVSKLQIARIEKDEQKQREQAAREKELQKQVETLRTQLEFKEREIVEAQTSFRSLQQRVGQGGSQQTAETSHPSPRKSPRLVQVNSPLRPAFPSKMSFMAGGSKQAVSSPMINSESPRKNKMITPGCLVSPGSSSSPSTMVTKTTSLPQLDAAVRTKARYTKGCISPSQLIGKLMTSDGSPNKEGSCDQTSLLSVFTSEVPGLSGNTDAEMEVDPSKTTQQMAASHSISRLLNPPCDAVEYQPRPISGHLTALSSACAADSHLADLLPLIQEQLACYVGDLEALAAAISSQRRDHPTIQGQETDLARQEESVSRLREQALEPGLNTLSRLCCYSNQVCAIVRAGHGRLGEAMVTSADELDPSAPILSTQTLSRTGSSVLSSVLSSQREPCRIVQILRSILSFRQVRGHPHSGIIDGGWRVVCVLARDIPDSKQLNWCLPFLRQDSLGIALSSSSSMATKMSVVLTMAALARVHPLCSQSDNCPLLHICHLGITRDKNVSDDSTVLLRTEIMHLLLAVVSCPASGVSSLVESNCQCSFEVISSIVSMMFSELKLAEVTATSQRFYLFQQGLLLLHTMQLQTKAFHEQKTESEMELMLLAVRLHRLMKKCNKVDDNTAAILQDLWECVAADDDIWGDDESEEDDAMQE